MSDNASYDAQKRTLLNEREAAKVLNICPRKLWGLADAGVVPFIRIGVKSKRYDLKDLEQYIAASRRGSFSHDAMRPDNS